MVCCYPIMKAIVISHPGGPEVLQLQEYPKPQPGPLEVLIAVQAAGLNRSDVLQRKGGYAIPDDAPATIPGIEVAGIIEQCGAEVTQWKQGDKVCALVVGGGYAEYIAVKEGQCLPVPEGFSFADAAGLPETTFTVWSNIFQRGGLQPGENLLVHGGSSGIGITAIQIAKAMGANVFVTVGSTVKGETCLELGATQYVNYKTQDFEQELAKKGIDVILDMVGGEYLTKNINILRPEGRLVYINASAAKPELDIIKIMQKRISITGSMLRSRDYAFKKALAEEVFKNVWPMITSGKYKSVIYKTFPFAEAADAHRLMESSEHIGKIILVMN